MDSKPKSYVFSDLQIEKLYNGEWMDDVFSITVENENLDKARLSFISHAHRILNSIMFLPHVWFAAVHHDTIRKGKDFAGVSELPMPESGNVLARAIRDFDEYCKVDEYYHSQFSSILFTQIVSSWTVYEMLATDVWTAAVNCLPNSLGRNAWAGLGKATPDSDDDGEAHAGTSFDINLLAEYEYNLSESMGSMMKSKRKYGFNKLEDIAAAYKAAFRIVGKKPNQSGNPSEVLGWFSGSNYDDLKLLEAIRHVTVHRGGFVDKQFQLRIASHKTFKMQEIDELVALNGEIVCSCTTAAMQCGLILLKGVDKWLTANKSSK